MSGFPEMNRLFEYHRRANGALLATLPDDAPSHERAYRIFGHIVNVDRVWLNRIADGEQAAVPEMFPLLTRDTLTMKNEQNFADVMLLLDDPQRGAFDRAVSFVTTEGTPLSSTIGAILFHMVNHATYHRGQVALLLGGSGVKPAATDYLLFDVGVL